MPDQIGILNEQLQILWEENCALRAATAAALAHLQDNGTQKKDIIHMLMDVLGENNDNSSPK